MLFGYIAINQPELKIREYVRYHSFYCGLCRSLKQCHGRIGQMTLTYDMTFVCLVLTGLYEPETKEEYGRCLIHPFRKHCFLTNEISSYTADMNLLMTYYKCMDDWKDAGKPVRRLETLLMHHSVKKIREQYPDKLKKIDSAMKEIAEGEGENCQDIDQMSGAFGKVMGELFCYRQDEWTPVLYRMGFFLGKFVYLMDAYEDIEEDRKAGTFNPLLSYLDREDFDDWCKDILTMMMAECARAFEVLPIVQDAELMRNVLYAGVWTRYEQVRERRKESREKSQ